MCLLRMTTSPPWCEMACVFVCVCICGKEDHLVSKTVGLAYVLAGEANARHPEVCWQMWTDAWSGSAAGISPHMCWHRDIAHTGHTSNAPKDPLVICRNLFLKGQKSTLTKCSGDHCTTAACTCLLHPPQIRLGPSEGTAPALQFPEAVESTRL